MCSFLALNGLNSGKGIKKILSRFSLHHPIRNRIGMLLILRRIVLFGTDVILIANEETFDPTPHARP